MGLCFSDAAISPLPASNLSSTSFLITEHVKHAAYILLKYPALCDVFLGFALGGKWVTEFLDGNPNLFSVLNRPDTETQFQLMMQRQSNKVNTPTHNGSGVHSSATTPGGHSTVNQSNMIMYFEGNSECQDHHGHKSPLLEIDIDWVHSFVNAPEPLLSIILACAFPLFIQSREFEAWQEMIITESAEQAELGREIFRDTLVFRLGENDGNDIKQSNEDKNNELRDLEGTFVTVLHPRMKHISFAHRGKSVRETLSSRVAHRANRIEAIIRSILGLFPFQPKSSKSSCDNNDAPLLYQTLKNMFPSLATTGNGSASKTGISSTPQSSPRSATIPPTLSVNQAQDCLWIQHLQTFLNQIKIPMFIARVVNHHQHSSFLGRFHHVSTAFPSEKHHFTIVAMNTAYTDLTKLKPSDILGRTVYNIVLEKSNILSQHCPARGPAADSALSALYPVHFLLESKRGNGELYPNLFMLKPVHHVIAQPAYHYLIGVQYDLSPPMAILSSDKSFLTASSRTRSDAAMMSSVKSATVIVSPTNHQVSQRLTPINTARSASGSVPHNLSVIINSNYNSSTPPMVVSPTSTVATASSGQHPQQPLRRSISEFPSAKLANPNLSAMNNGVASPTNAMTKAISPTAMMPMIVSARLLHEDSNNNTSTAGSATATGTSSAGNFHVPRINTHIVVSHSLPAHLSTKASHHPILTPLIYKMVALSSHSHLLLHHSSHFSTHPTSPSMSAANIDSLQQQSSANLNTNAANQAANKYIQADSSGSNHDPKAPNNSQKHTIPMTFQYLEQDMPMIEDILNLVPHLLI